MDPRQAASQFESWRATLLNSIGPVLLQARSQLIAAQARPEPDEGINRIEQLSRATLEPVFLQAEMALEGIRQAYDSWLSAQEEQSEKMLELQSHMCEAVGRFRDWTDRKVNSLVAQARAQELMPLQAPPQQQAQPQAQAQAQAQAQPQPRPQPAVAEAKVAFCSECGAKVTAEMIQRGECGACQSEL